MGYKSSIFSAQNNRIKGSLKLEGEGCTFSFFCGKSFGTRARNIFYFLLPLWCFPFESPEVFKFFFVREVFVTII